VLLCLPDPRINRRKPADKFSARFFTEFRRTALPRRRLGHAGSVLRHEIPSGARALRRKATMLPDCRIGGSVAAYELEDASTTR
jgi:hypothetical protein